MVRIISNINCIMVLIIRKTDLFDYPGDSIFKLNYSKLFNWTGNFDFTNEATSFGLHLQVLWLRSLGVCATAVIVIVIETSLNLSHFGPTDYPNIINVGNICMDRYVL